MHGMICKTQRAAERVRESITKFIEGKLFLKVNKEKTVVVYMKSWKLPKTRIKNLMKCGIRRYDASRWGSCWMTIRDSPGGGGEGTISDSPFYVKDF